MTDHSSFQLPEGADSYSFIEFDANTLQGKVVLKTGEQRAIFTRAARSQRRAATEHLALTLIRQHTQQETPVPLSIGTITIGQSCFILTSYETGSDLASLLPEQPNSPPLPPGYTRAAQPKPAAIDLLLLELGRAIKAMHAIHLDRYGRLVGTDPNPHQRAGRLYTLQEGHHGLETAVERGWFTPQQSDQLRHWLELHSAIIEDTEPPCLIHYDLHPGNIRAYEDEEGRWHLRSIIDFEHARGWSAEYDLVPLYWYLGATAERYWQRFLEGYQPEHKNFAGRLRFFEMVVAVGVLGYREKDESWGRWVYSRVQQILGSPLEATHDSPTL